MYEIRLESSFLLAAHAARKLAQDKNLDALVFRLADFWCIFVSTSEITLPEAISIANSRFNIGEYSYSNNSEPDPRWQEDKALKQIPDNEIFGEE